MMNEMLPPAGSDIAGALSVLSVISDPEAARKRLAELAKAQASYNTSLDEVRRISNETQAERKAAEEAKLKAESDLAEIQLTHRKVMALEANNKLAEQRIAARSKDLDERTKDLENAKAAFFSARDIEHQAINNQKNALDQRDTTLAERELAHQRRETDHAERVADLQRAIQKHIK